jgi:serine/threonine protein kinase
MSDDGAPRTAGDQELLEALLTRHIEGRLGGSAGDGLAALCADRPDLIPRLQELVARYEEIDRSLAPASEPAPSGASLPTFPGFRTIERLGRGGGGEVYKLEDLTLGRVVAAKVLRRDGPLASGVADFVREARSLALFEDPRFVRLLEYKASDPPILLMEYVDGFALSEIGPALEMRQRARLVTDVADAIQHAHDLGIQHRDLKPANILVDEGLRPHILDFGLARADRDRGHGRGTLAYMAPEQLDATQPIDGRADVYALGVVLFELLCGARPYEGTSEDETIEAIRRGEPPLPRELDAKVPEPLQSIALKAMAREPADRYASARDMATDLRRYLEGRPVLARPHSYRSALERRIRPHLDQIEEWLRLNLIYPHEARNLRSTYRKLEDRDGDWILGARVVSFSQITLYLGALLLATAGLLYFVAHARGAVTGVSQPLLVLGLPLAALALAAFRLDRGAHKPAAVAFHLGAAVLLPPLLLILFRELGWFSRVAPWNRELFETVTNRQLQAALLVTAVWLALLALRTRTVALSSGFAGLLLLFHLALLSDWGLRQWLEDERWDALAYGLGPLVIAAIVLGSGADRWQRPFLAQPLHFLAVGALVASLELLALQGRAMALLGITLAPMQGPSVTDPLLLDTVAAMVLNGIGFLVLGVLIDARGTQAMKLPARMLEAIAPYAILEPIAVLVETGEYSRRVDWAFLVCALAVAYASRFRQRRGFFTAGLANTAAALYFITDHYQWLERIGWATSVLLAGVAALVVGLLLERAETRRRAQV